MPLHELQTYGLSASPSSSPRGSFDSTLSSSSTLCSSTSDSSPPSSLYEVTPTPPTQMYSNTMPRQRRVTPPQRLLGAIDEDSPNVQPDVPLSAKHDDHPLAKLHVYAAIVKSKNKRTLACPSSPPANPLDMVIGPNGETFADVRMNRKAQKGKGFGKFMCFA